MDQKRISWLDGIKALGCMIVFWNHFYLIFLGNNPTASSHAHPALSTFFDWANLLVNGNFGMCIFIIVSGYLAAQKKIDRFSHLCKELLLRYLKFVIALLGVSLFILIIHYTIGFQTTAWGATQIHAWNSYYSEPFSIWEYLKFIFLLDSFIDMPAWTLLPIFLGNALIFLLNYLTRKLHDWVKILVSVLFFATGMIVGYPGFGTWKQPFFYVGLSFVGVLLPYLWKLFSLFKEWILGILLLCALIGANGGYKYVVSYASMVTFMHEIFYSPIYWNALLSVVIMCFLGAMKSMRKILSNKILLGINKLSFPIYLLHFPAIYSIGMLLNRLLVEKTNYTFAFLLTFIILQLFIVGLAWVYNRTWNSWSNRVLAKLRTLLK